MWISKIEYKSLQNRVDNLEKTLYGLIEHFDLFDAREYREAVDKVIFIPRNKKNV